MARSNAVDDKPPITGGILAGEPAWAAQQSRRKKVRQLLSEQGVESSASFQQRQRHS